MGKGGACHRNANRNFGWALCEQIKPDTVPNDNGGKDDDSTEIIESEGRGDEKLWDPPGSEALVRHLGVRGYTGGGGKEGWVIGRNAMSGHSSSMYLFRRAEGELRRCYGRGAVPRENRRLTSTGSAPSSCSGYMN